MDYKFILKYSDGASEYLTNIGVRQTRELFLIIPVEDGYDLLFKGKKLYEIILETKYGFHNSDKFRINRCFLGLNLREIADRLKELSDSIESVRTAPQMWELNSDWQPVEFCACSRRRKRRLRKQEIEQ